MVRKAGSARSQFYLPKMATPGICQPAAIIVAALLSGLCLCACSRKTGSIQVGPDQPGIAVSGDDIRLNPGLLGLEDSQGFTIDTYSDGSISINLDRQQDTSSRSAGKAF